MDNILINKIDELIEDVTPDVIADTIKLVNIKSVMSEPKPGAPFGEGVRKVLDTVLEMGEKDGFHTKDYDVGVISLAMKPGQPDLGIWVHGDVVPEGDNWRFEPYNAVEYKGCIIGRGVTDNKGQLAAIYNLMKIFKKLGIELKYNTALYVGSCEENGMKDLVGLPDNTDAKGFLNVAKPPKLSLVPDGGFPVGYCGKGGIVMRLKSKTALHGFTLIAGQPTSPGKARAEFDDTNKPPVSTESPPVHGAHPDPNGNMITMICAKLLDENMVHEDDRHILDFIRRMSKEIDGKTLNIDVPSEHLGTPIVFTHRIDCADGKPEVYINIRYTEKFTSEELIARIAEAAGANGFEISYIMEKNKPYILDPDTEVIKALTEVSNSVTGEDKKPFSVSGGTYAHWLPNGLVYGTNGNLPPDDFPKGRGGAHGIDEAVSVARLQRAMRIYARALLKLNEMEW